MNQKQTLHLNDLLQWGIVNSTNNNNNNNNNNNSHQLQPIDSKWIDLVLGRPDSVRMRDCMTTITDRSLDISVRLHAFDELELLVESIDNANDLQPCKLWEPLLGQMADPAPEIRSFAAWVVGTAIQNNPQATTDFFENGGLQALTHAASEKDDAVTAKIVGVVSALVNQGWADRLDSVLQTLASACLFNAALFPKSSFRLIRVLSGTPVFAAQLAVVRTGLSAMKHSLAAVTDNEYWEVALAFLLAVSRNLDRECLPPKHVYVDLIRMATDIGGSGDLVAELHIFVREMF